MSYSSVSQEEFNRLKQEALRKFHKAPSYQDIDTIARNASSMPPEIAIKTGCKHALLTNEPYQVNRPCKGRKIICQLDGHPSYHRACTPENCAKFEDCD